MKKASNRDPSIHVTKSTLRAILIDQIDIIIDNGNYNSEDLVNTIFKAAKKYTVQHRCLLESSQKTARKAEKLTLSNIGDAQLFSQLITLVRRQMHHKGIAIIREDGKEWPQIKEATKLAIDFCNDFEITDKHNGFISYITATIKAMGGKFTLNRVNSMHSFTCELYRAQERIRLDTHPDETKAAEEHYNRIILTKVGFGPSIITQPTKYQYFIDIVDNSNKAGVSPEIYIDAQFAAFDWKAAIPEISQMTGDKAMERLAKYMYHEGIQAKKPAEKAITFKRIRSND